MIKKFKRYSQPFAVYTHNLNYLVLSENNSRKLSIGGK